LLEETVRAALATQLRRAVFPPGDVAAGAIDPASLYLVESGRGVLLATIAGRRLAVEDLGPGAPLAGAELAGGGAPMFAVEAAIRLEATEIPPRALAAIEDRFPLAAARLGRLRSDAAERRMRRLCEGVADLLRGEKSLLGLLAHDLRAPLITMSAAVGELLDRGAKFGPLSPRQEKILRRASRAGLLLRQLVDEIVDIGRSEASAPRGDRTTVAAVLRETIPMALAAAKGVLLEAGADASDYAAVREAARGHGVSLDVDPAVLEEPLVVDEPRLIRAISNLVANALRYAPGTVSVAARREGALLEIAVVDCGPGIPEPFRARVFDRLRQREARAAGVAGGSGLGLAAAGEMAEALGGSIRAEEGVGGIGTRIVLRIPAWAAPAP
jgi:signal transduction histidine kinase